VKKNLHTKFADFLGQVSTLLVAKNEPDRSMGLMHNIWGFQGLFNHLDALDMAKMS
jgi:hypothetical protein